MRWVRVASLFLAASLTRADWSPPADPDPQRILQEIRSDIRAKRYADALAKQVWFHENVLKLQPSFYGVRLSFALASWVELGAVYPPALEKLKSVRDEAARQACEGPESRGAFHDFSAINRVLKENDKTKDLFVWLDANRPAVAKEAFEIARPALITAGEYRLCGAYVAADPSFRRILKLHRDYVRSAREDPGNGKQLQDFAEKRFCNEAATLVALLALSERKADAELIALEALKERDSPSFREQLERAKRGEVPAPWP